MKSYYELILFICGAPKGHSLQCTSRVSELERVHRGYYFTLPEACYSLPHQYSQAFNLQKELLSSLYSVYTLFDCFALNIFKICILLIMMFYL